MREALFRAGILLRLVLLTTAAACVSPSAGASTPELSRVPDDTWMVDGPRVQEVLVVGDIVVLAGEFRYMVDPSGKTREWSRNLVALDAASGAPIWTRGARHASAERSMVWDVDVSADGAILFVCGDFDLVAGAARQNVAALDAATGRLLSWAPTGLPICRSITSSGDHVVVGTGRAIRALTPDGSVAWMHRTDGAVLTAVNDGSAVFVGGQFTMIDDIQRSVVAKLDAETGSVDTSWALSSVPYVDAGEGEFALDLLLDGGALYVAAGGADYAARFEADDGGLTWWTDTSGAAQAVELLADGTLAVGGHFQWVADEDTRDCGTNLLPVTSCSSRLRLATLDASTGALLPWETPVSGHYNGVWSIESDSLGKVHLGGEFTSVGGAQQQYYARLAPAN